MMELSQGLWPQVVGIGMRVATLAAVSSDMPMPLHTTVSNVPGPQAPIYLAGARVHLMMGMGPIMDMMGLFHGVISGAGKLTINFVSCREMLPDPEFYRHCLQTAYDELETAALAPAKRSRAKRKKVPA